MISTAILFLSGKINNKKIVLFISLETEKLIWSTTKALISLIRLSSWAPAAHSVVMTGSVAALEDPDLLDLTVSSIKSCFNAQ